MRKPHFYRICGLLLPLLLSLSVYGQIRVVSTAPFTGGVLTSSVWLSSGSMLRIYNTADQTTNYERFSVGYTSNTVTMLAEHGGTGGSRSIVLGTTGSGAILFRTFGSDRWQMTNAGMLLPAGTSIGNVDIGSSAAAVRSVYTSGGIYLSAQTAPAAPSAGAVLYIDTADSDLKIKYSDGTVVVIGNKP
jgi:hypothetical protein